MTAVLATVITEMYKTNCRNLHIALCYGYFLKVEIFPHSQLPCVSCIQVEKNYLHQIANRSLLHNHKRMIKSKQSMQNIVAIYT